MTPWVVLPVKLPEEAKRRLQPALSPAARARVARWLARRTLAVLAASWAGPVIVVTRDPAIAARARRHGFAVELERGGSHSEAARQGASQAARAGAPAVLALAADLPLLRGADLDALRRRARPGVAVIAPDRLGRGTNAVLAPPDFPFGFGAPSFRRHLALALDRGLRVEALRTPGLAVDLDLPWDLDLVGADPLHGFGGMATMGRRDVRRAPRRS